MNTDVASYFQGEKAEKHREGSEQELVEVTVQLTRLEYRMIGDERCDCGHLLGFHNIHFCNVPGCQCSKED
jgi:hypothetical protein